MFNLNFVSTGKFSAERSEEVALGEISLRNFTENFWASLSIWKIEDYEKQWIEGAKRILEFNRTVFITDLNNPKTSNFITWWKAWRINEQIFVQNQLLLFSETSSFFDLNNPYELIGERTTETKNREKVSEWEVSLQDIKNFLKGNE